ncbi:FG-GAP-like repeat-containing protein [Streptomyces sp. MNU76]|uniref:FG-GAP repeat protein n=1 Tax=Streptomyces sp. MNU76 TaxID=2560026 RepID=UPI001E3B52D4|nr:FG-GAP repeat protein [Streptomyces sp. MNU76]MCC9709186.1 FG-GAP-like repeat-containing protein [Streptomyces sp. MNU76]
MPSSVAGVAAAATCTAGTSTDFNGDSVVDTVVADPNATVSGVKGAGLVRVILGGGKGVVEISQATPGMNAAPEPGDGFGTSRTTYDADGDGCTDLVVGVPYEDVGAVTDAGAVQVFRPLVTIGAADRLVTRGSGLPGTATRRDHLGMSRTVGANNLYVGVPFSKASGTTKGVLHVLTWADLDGTTSTGATTYQPGSGGLPDNGVSFGVVG